mmetsp:Transcript_32458/g.65771  ORF Transcript_32458/g.65771 Transcript_32458/m.65771 type:complete len:448 (-) Transcript_32458:91-1434(-)
MPRGRPPSNKSAAAAGSGSSAQDAALPVIPSPYASLDTDAALSAMDVDAEDLVNPALFRLTSGMPLHELEAMVKETDGCERALIEEIRILEEAAGVGEADLTPRAAPVAAAAAAAATGDGADGAIAAGEGEAKMEVDGTAAASSLPAHFTNVEDMLASDLSAASGFYGVSALLGRLRNPLEMPLPPNSPALIAATGNKKGRKKGGGGGGGGTDKEAQRKEKDAALAKTRALLALEKDPSYTKVLDDNAPLLALCKRITNHRSSVVFRRPVNPREAPGYAERIVFPLDLSLVKKMVQAGMIRTFRELHERMGLICHNCVKYNGRESDYGGVTRDFEGYVDDSIILAVRTYNVNAERAAAAAAAAAAKTTEASAATAPVSAATSASVVGEGTAPPSDAAPAAASTAVETAAASAASAPPAPATSVAGDTAAAAAAATSTNTNAIEEKKV